MKPAPFAYLRPSTLEEALAALADTQGAKVLAGGQSLVPLLSMRLAAPSMLVDINALPDLGHVRVAEDGVRVGALAVPGFTGDRVAVFHRQGGHGGRGFGRLGRGRQVLLGRQ